MNATPEVKKDQNVTVLNCEGCGREIDVLPDDSFIVCLKCHCVHEVKTEKDVQTMSLMTKAKYSSAGHHEAMLEAVIGKSLKSSRANWKPTGP